MKYTFKDKVEVNCLFNCKFDATEWTVEMKVDFQENLSELGISWLGGASESVQNLKGSYYYIKENLLTYGIYESTFHSNGLTEYKWQDIFEPVHESKSNFTKTFDMTKWDVSCWSADKKRSFQEYIFSNGVVWEDGTKSITGFATAFYYINNGILTNGYSCGDFRDHVECKRLWEDVFLPYTEIDKRVGVTLKGIKLDESNFNKHVLSESLSPEELVGWKEGTESTKEDIQDASAFTIDKESILSKVGLFDVPTTEWTDKHYDNYYTLTDEDIEEGKIRIDAYFVNRMWKLNSIDDTGCAFHCLKTYTRMANGKNSMERELNALNGQLKRWAKLMNVKLK